MKNTSARSKNESINGTGIRRGFEGALVRFDKIYLRELDSSDMPDFTQKEGLLEDDKPILRENSYSPVNLIRRMRSLTRLSYYNEDQNYSMESFTCPAYISQMSSDELGGTLDNTNSFGERCNVTKNNMRLFTDDTEHLRVAFLKSLNDLFDNCINKSLISFILKVNWRKLHLENRHCEYLDLRSNRITEYKTFLEANQKVRRKIYEQLTTRKHIKTNKGNKMDAYFEPYLRKVKDYIKVVWVITLTLIILSE